MAGRRSDDGGDPRAGRAGGRVSRMGGILRWTLIAMVWGAVAAAALVAWFAYDIPLVDSLETPVRRESVTVADSAGRPVLTYGDYYAEVLSFDDAPRDLVNAILAVEDRNFFSHDGFDPWAIVRALAVNLFAGEVRQGASTLTQQLAKNLFLTSERTVRRKVQELLLAFWLEAAFTKRQIFTLYLNRVYLGSGTYGVDGAARRYFGKSARRLTLLESAVVAGLLKAPSRYSPLRSRDSALKRAHVVLGAMRDAGFIGEARLRAALRQRLRTTAAGPAGGGRYFTDWALEKARSRVGSGKGDLVVRTTLDTRLQAIAERRLGEIIAEQGGKRGVSQAAVVVMTREGAVRALVGGVDYRRSQFNRASDARRQPGSVFKLFVYLAGLENGVAASDRFVDRPFSVGKWRPRNYPDRYRGSVTVREAFVHSINTVAVQVSERVGRGRVAEAARRLGVTPPSTRHPSLALGTGGASLLRVTGAYGVIANSGFMVLPHAILEIKRRSGESLYRRRTGPPVRIVDAAAAREMHTLLRAVVTSGTGRRAAIGAPAAGKTGTSQRFRDAWFVGYADGLVTGVWMGNDDGTAMKGVTGGSLPALLWRRIMADALGLRG